MTVHATLQLQATGPNTTGFEIPDEVVGQLGGGRRPKVVATIDGFAMRTSITRMGGAYWLGVSAARRAEAGDDRSAPVRLTWALQRGRGQRHDRIVAGVGFGVRHEGVRASRVDLQQPVPEQRPWLHQLGVQAQTLRTGQVGSAARVVVTSSANGHSRAGSTTTADSLGSCCRPPSC